jgi:hypothetical protein
VHADSALDADLERFCRAHDSALRAVDAVLADDAGEDDAVAILIGSLEAVTSTLAADLRATGSSLHPRVEPLVAAAEQTAAGAREALDADHDARHDYIADQLAGASYLQPLVDDPAPCTRRATGLAACEDLPLGAVDGRAEMPTTATADRRGARGPVRPREVLRPLTSGLPGAKVGGELEVRDACDQGSHAARRPRHHLRAP